MKEFKKIFDYRMYLVTGFAVVSFSNFIVELFGQTIPNLVMSFFKDAGAAVILGLVFVFAITWLLRTRPHNRPKNYSVVVFDVYGFPTKIEGLRTEFKTHDVAWSYMKLYKNSYPLNNFALVSQLPKSDKKTIFRYI